MQDCEVPRFIQPSYEDYDNHRYCNSTRICTKTSHECHRCDRRLWYRDSILVIDTPLHFCKECISHMVTAYKIGRRLGTGRPWGEPPIIEMHIRTFLDPAEDLKLVQRRRFEAAWVAILSSTKTKVHGTSSRYTIADLDYSSLCDEHTGVHPTMSRYELWLGTGRKYVDIDNETETFIIITLLEYVIKFL